MDNLRRLEEIFAHFPGIGPRQARRFVYYLLSRSQSTVKEFADLVMAVKQNSTECPVCHRFFLAGKTTTGAADCNICTDAARDHEKLMIVARDVDFESIEKSGAYKGLYFILGGTVPILDQEPDKKIRLQKLLDQVRQNTELKEIILSLNTTPDGEHTAEIVHAALQKNIPNMKVTVLGRGLSTGAELEYADNETIRNALQNRH